LRYAQMGPQGAAPDMPVAASSMPVSPRVH